MATHRKLTRLGRVWVPHAVYFITTCTQNRKAILAHPDAATVLREEWTMAKDRHGWLIGRYVIMPDHIHFFCAEQPGGDSKNLSQFMQAWKQWTAKGLGRALVGTPPIWQAGFFDHILRSSESYAEKWIYVRENPVRASLVSTWTQWPFQGWIDFDHPLGGQAEQV
jgi:putative transposase